MLIHQRRIFIILLMLQIDAQNVVYIISTRLLLFLFPLPSCFFLAMLDLILL